MLEGTRLTDDAVALLRHRTYSQGVRAADEARPLIALDVDGVIALDSPPAVPCTLYEVSAHAKWRREVAVADGTAAMLQQLTDRCEMAWTGAWSFNAHEAFSEVLGLPAEPWAFFAVQFHAEPLVAQYAGRRPWVWITESTIGGLAGQPRPGVITVDPRRGLTSLDLGGLLNAVGLE